MDSVSLGINDKNEYDEYVLHDSDDEDDNDLDTSDSYFNEIWRNNKQFILEIIGEKGVSQNLINYGKNLILYYQNKIASIKKLLESKGMDNTKNFVGDVTIQNQQNEKIKDIKNNSLIAKTEPKLLDSMFSKYYTNVGKHADEVMDKDYENRHKTIMYDLLIKEYELNIEQTKKTIQYYDEEHIKDNDITNLLSQFGGDKKFTQNGGLVNDINIDDINQSSETFEDNTDNIFSLFIEEYKLIENDLITNPLVITQILDIMLKIRNAENNPSLITDRYFNLHELKLLFSNVPKYTEVYNLEGGNPYSASNPSASNPYQAPSNALPDKDEKKQIENIEKMKENLELRKNELKIRESKVARVIAKLQKDIKQKNDEIEKIKKSEVETKEKEKKIQDAYDELLNTVKESMDNIMDFFLKQTNTINESNMKLKKNISRFQKHIEEHNINNYRLSLMNEIYSLDINLFEKDIEKCEKQIDNTINELIENKEDILENFSFGKKLSPKEHFYHNYIANNFLKKNLYNFILECKKLDSIPEWRANISQLIVGYLSKYAVDPNSIDPNNPTYVTRIPTYDIFNIIIMGTPGVGKSFTADIIGKVLKYSGLLTKGDRHDIKKPDIVGSYTGQTAPKVYKEFTECLGKVIFIDEAYSIAGAKDETKGTYNEFGQESLDALTDYTSEHIGFSAFVAAGYEYEMNTQFLEVNIGLPRRFPTQLILKRYSLHSFWKILSNYLIKFVKKTHLENHHKACFELLNLIFNFQCGRNPTIQLPKNWITTWKSHTIKNIHVNLEIDLGNKNKIPIPFLELVDFNNLVINTDKNITSESVIECISKEFITYVSTLTKTFIKSYVLYNFCGILNGDLFRSQADNLTKFSQYMLEDKIINNSGKYNEKNDKKFEFGDINWIENCYFNLYFTKNPNYKIKNINYEFSEIEYKSKKLKLEGGNRKINKISKNNKKTNNRRSKRKQSVSIIDRLLQKMNNKLKGGKPENPESSDIDDDDDGDEDDDDDFKSTRTFFSDLISESGESIVSDDDANADDDDADDDDDDADDDADDLLPEWIRQLKFIIKYKTKQLDNFEADTEYEKGLKAYNSQNIEEATKYFLNALEISKVHADSYYLLAEMKYQDEALKYYNTAAHLGNIQSKFLVGCINYYWYKNNKEVKKEEHFAEDEKNEIIDMIKKYFDIDLLSVNLGHAFIDDSEERFIEYFTYIINYTSCILGNNDLEFIVFKLVEYYNTKKHAAKQKLDVKLAKEELLLMREFLNDMEQDLAAGQAVQSQVSKIKQDIAKQELEVERLQTGYEYIEASADEDKLRSDSADAEEKAIECLLKITETSSLANKKLGEIYTKRKDIDNALKYYEQSAKLGDIKIQIILGDYYNIENIEESFVDDLLELKNKENMDILKCIKYYKMSIDKFKDPVLIEKYKGRLYDVLHAKYNDVKKKYENDMYQKLIFSNEEKDIIEQYNIGKKFLNGEDDYSQNIEYGLTLIKKSADNNYADASFYYAKFFYDKLSEFDATKSKRENIKTVLLFETINTYLQKASDLNYIDAIYFYADILFNGFIYINEKKKEEVNLSKKEAVNLSKKEAVNLYKKGAELGDARCQLAYAILLSNPSDLIEKGDDHLAFMYFQMATENKETKTSALQNLNALKEQNRGMKELTFKLDIKYTNITDIGNLLIRISNFLKTDNSESDLIINPIFVIYNKHSVIFENAHENNKFDEFNTERFKDFIKIYILLKCYNEAINQSQIQDQKFTKESWWFFTNADFRTVLGELEIVSIMNLYNNKYKDEDQNKTKIDLEKKKN